MKTAVEKFNEALQQMIDEKVFSLEAVARIQQLKDLVVEQENKIETLTYQLKSQREETERIEHLHKKVESELAKLKEREDSVAYREKVLHESVKSQAVAEARAAAYRDAMAIVFAPNTLRERVISFAGQSMPNGQYTNNNEDTDRQITQGYSRPPVSGDVERDKAGKPTSL